MLGVVHMKIVFPLICCLIKKKKIISSHSYTKYFPTWVRFMLAGCYEGKFCEKPIFKMGYTDLKKNCIVLVYLNIPGLDTLYVCLMGVLHLLEIQRQHEDFSFFFTNIKAKKQLFKIFSNQNHYYDLKNEYVTFFCIASQEKIILLTV